MALNLVNRPYEHVFRYAVVVSSLLHTQSHAIMFMIQMQKEQPNEADYCRIVLIMKILQRRTWLGYV